MSEPLLALPPRSKPAALPRSEGRVEVAFRMRDGRTVLDRLHQEGSGKARLPRPLPGFPPEVALINMSGGITGGDRMAQSVRWGEGCHAIATTQAAEKVYRASLDALPARVENRLTVGPGASAEWLPQETILFDRARLRRMLDIDLASDARLLACEPIVFGRTAMGETVRSAFLQDGIRLRLDGRLAFADGLRFDGQVQAVLDRPAIAGGGRSLATVLYVGPDAADLIETVRAELDSFRSEAGRAAISRLGPVLVARFVAGDGACLRRMLAACLQVIRAAAGWPGGLPKLWSC